ncbi:uncharacterized protein LOC132204059 [Neocloeon triangulifer]|uniref:uncharacterized protein LOC132204059 n=1 Tax=Neocloeon triangulifer TaxID=2078957 RepID=UPI00286F6AB3|nr:uncharacterized protein LOC132204059 [Neocloeon triangulifer]
MNIFVPNFVFVCYFLSFIGFGNCKQICRDGGPQLQIAKEDIEEKDGTIFYANHAFRPGEYEADDNYFFTCPCDVKYCVKTCINTKSGLYSASPGKNLKVNVATKDGKTKNIDFYGHFYPETLDCYNGEMKVFTNQAVFFENRSVAEYFEGKLHLVANYPDFCIAQGQDFTDDGESRIYLCDGQDDDFEEYPQNKDINFSIHFLASAVFLLITAIAIRASKERESHLGKLSFCFSLTMMFMYLVLAAFYHLNRAGSVGFGLCRLYFFATFTLSISSFLWLNAICLKNLQLSRLPRNYTEARTSRFFVYSSLFSTLVPLLLHTIFYVASFICHIFGFQLNFALSSYTCYLEDTITGVIFCDGPVFLALILNLIFLIATRITSANLSWFVVCVLLFIVMACPVIVVFVLMLDKYQELSFIWSIYGQFNALRGFFIFLIIVIFNGNVRNSLFCRKKTTVQQLAMELS